MVNIETEFIDLMARQMNGSNARQVLDYLFVNGFINIKAARTEIIRREYFELIKQGETATEAKMILAVNYELSFMKIKRLVYGY